MGEAEDYFVGSKKKKSLTLTIFRINTDLNPLVVNLERSGWGRRRRNVQGHSARGDLSPDSQYWVCCSISSTAWNRGFYVISDCTRSGLLFQGHRRQIPHLPIQPCHLRMLHANFNTTRTTPTPNATPSQLTHPCNCEVLGSRFAMLTTATLVSAKIALESRHQIVIPSAYRLIMMNYSSGRACDPLLSNWRILQVAASWLVLKLYPFIVFYHDDFAQIILCGVVCQRAADTRPGSLSPCSHIWESRNLWWRSNWVAVPLDIMTLSRLLSSCQRSLCFGGLVFTLL